MIYKHTRNHFRTFPSNLICELEQRERTVSQYRVGAPRFVTFEYKNSRSTSLETCDETVITEKFSRHI